MLVGTASALADYIGWSNEYRTMNGLTFKRIFTEQDPTGSKLRLVKAGNNYETYGLVSDHGKFISNPQTPPNATSPYKQVGEASYGAESYVIPGYVDGLPVVEIAPDAFAGNTTMKLVDIQLMAVDTLYAGTFKDCTALETFTTSNATSGRYVIKGAVFEGCTGLKALSIPASIKAIYGNAFKGCTNLEEVLFVQSYESILLADGDAETGTADQMFADCPLKTVTLNRLLADNVKNPTDYVTFVNPFRNITTLQEVIIGPAQTSIRPLMFRGFTTPVKVTATGVTTIGDYAFENSNNLTLNIPNMKIIGKRAFRNGATAAFNFAGVEEIGEEAFLGVPFVDLVIPASVQRICYNAFNDDGSVLKTVKIEDGTTPIELGYRKDYYERYYGTTEWSQRQYQTYGQKWLTSTSVEEIYIGRPLAHETTETYDAGLQYQDASRFDYATFPNLKKVSLPQMRTLPYGAFAGDATAGTKLTDVNIPLVTALPSHCFSNCYTLPLASIIAPAVTSIGEYCFENCTFTAYTVPEKVTTIGPYAFAGTPITSFTVPATVTSLGSNVFDGCTSLTKVTVDYNYQPLQMTYVFKLGTLIYTLGNCPALQELYFNRNLMTQTIGQFTTRLYLSGTETYVEGGTVKTETFLPALQYVEFGANVTSLDGFFLSKDDLRLIRCKSTQPPLLVWNNGSDATGPTVRLAVQSNVWVVVPDAALASYKQAYVWKGFAHLVGESQYGDGAGSGDVNGDRLLDTQDVVDLTKSLMGNAPAGFNAAAADVNGDGKVNVADIICVINNILTTR